MPYFRPEIEAMAGYQPGEQPQTADVIKLNTNENPYPCSPAVVEAVRRTAAESLRRYPDPMAGAFRRCAAERLSVEPDWILCGNGSDDILTIVTRALVGQGDLLRLPYPSYILYRTLAELQAAQSEEVHFNSDWTLPAAFAAAADRLRVVFLANPNSPSGTMIAPDRVLELAERLPCPMLVDEAYVDFADTNCMDLVARCDRVMVSRSLSKSYALAGLRFGYLVAQPHFIEQFIKVKDSYNCDAVAIAAATAAIGDEAWLAENRSRILATRARLTARLRELGFNVVDSQANFVWATHAATAVRPIFERLREQRTYVRYMNYAAWGDGLRVSVGTDEQIDRFLEQLEGIL